MHVLLEEYSKCGWIDQETVFAWGAEGVILYADGMTHDGDQSACSKKRMLFVVFSFQTSNSYDT